MSKGIVLLSGGLDSTLCLLRLLKEGNEVTPMFVDYNQWSLEEELQAARDIVNWGFPNKGLSVLEVLEELEVERLEVVKAELGDRRKVGSAWGRTIALVGLAAMWAYTHGDDYDFIVLGMHKGDVGPDCKPGGLFETDLDHVLRDATKSKMKLYLPIRDLTIEDIGKELATFGIPWETMYSCYWAPSCGFRSPHDSYRCPGCRRKVIAMQAAGVTDKELLELPNCRERTYQSPLAEKTGY